MFVGHYSASLVGKAAAPQVPLWLLLLAAQLVDVVWAGLVLTGVERVRLDPQLPSNPLDLVAMPYTHSLVGAIAWAGAAGWIAARLPRLGGTRRAGIVVAGVVLSHWLLDLIVHRPDLTLWGAAPKLGLGLWNAPLLAYALELALLAGGAAVCVRRAGLPAHARNALAIAVGALAALQTAVAFGPIPTSVTALVTSVLLVFAAVTFAGWWMERRAGEA